MRDSKYDNIYKFFEDNTKDHSDELPYFFSSLYLLIRDAKVCLKLDPSYEEGHELRTYGAQWPALMTIFSGIDLMGKFLAGCDSNGEVGTRFKDFIIQYFDEGNIDEEPKIIYLLRNALDHSFNLYSRDYNFSLVDDPSEPLILDKTIENNIYKQINVYKLYKNFQSACKKYHNDLLKPENESLRENFNEIYSKYGTTYMY